MIVTIDPGVHGCGWAEFTGGKLNHACYIADSDTDKSNRLIKLAHNMRPTTYASLVVIEVPRVYPGARENDPNDLIDLAFVAGSLVGGFPSTVRIETVYPRTWKGQVPKAVMCKRIEGLLSEDERANITPVSKTLRHNVLDAIGIGLFQLRRM